MGTIHHNAIIVTGWNREHLEEAHRLAKDLFRAYDPDSNSFDSERTHVTPIVEGQMNDYASFMVAPDGSKEGWGISDHFDNQREEFRRYLAEATIHPVNGFGNGSRYLDWAFISYGELEDTLDTPHPETR